MYVNRTRRKFIPRRRSAYCKKSANSAVSSYSRSRRYRRRPAPFIKQIRSARAPTFPQKLFAKLTYNDTGFTATPAVGNSYLVQQAFRGNSIYDPDATGVGVQPYYYDTFAGVYSRYRVYASKISVYVFSTDEAGTSPQIKTSIIPWPTSAGPTYTAPDDVRVLFKCKQISWNQDRNDRKSTKLTNYAKTKQVFENLYDNDLWANIGSNPSTMWYWQLYFDTTNTSTETDIVYDVKIVYYVEFSRKSTQNEPS